MRSFVFFAVPSSPQEQWCQYLPADANTFLLRTCILRGSGLIDTSRPVNLPTFTPGKSTKRQANVRQGHRVHLLKFFFEKILSCILPGSNIDLKP
jgi:hypothetical protein